MKNMYLFAPAVRGGAGQHLIRLAGLASGNAILRVLGLIAVIGCLMAASDSVGAHSYRYYSDAELQTYLSTTASHKLLPSRAGQPILRARHRQYGVACGIFTAAPIVEYMGYARYEPSSSFVRDVTFLRYKAGEQIGTALEVWPSDVEWVNTLDVGYYGSAEFIAQDLLQFDSYNHPNRTEGYMADVLGAINGNPKRGCDYAFGGTLSDPPYGECAFDPAYEYPEWLDEIKGTVGRPTDTYGLLGYHNRYSELGCKDGKSFKYPSSLEMLDGVLVAATLTTQQVDHYRRIVKEFVDQHIPLQAYIRYGGHFVNIIGYANLDADGLPRDIITVNPRLDQAQGLPWGCPGPRPLYWVYRDMDDPVFWAEDHNQPPLSTVCEDNTTTQNQVTAYDNLLGIVLWLQHLEMGCEAPDGWAYRLDQELGLADDMALCSEVAEVPDWGQCKRPTYATTIECRREGSNNARALHRQYIVYDDELDITGHHFEVETRNTTCDEVQVYLGYPETERRLESALIQREGWNPATSTWDLFQTWESDIRMPTTMETGQTGKHYRIAWDDSWPEDYWLAASGLAGDHTSRRTGITLEFDDGSSQVLWIGPPGPIPVPRIFINGTAGQISLPQSSSARLSMSLDNRGLTDPVDFWLVADTPTELFFFGPSGWSTTPLPWFQGALFYSAGYELPPIPLSGFPRGEYYLYFGVDTVMDGLLTMDSAYYDSVMLEILPPAVMQ